MVRMSKGQGAVEEKCAVQEVNPAARRDSDGS